jgi:glycosyltransferase involved in cell wall biosynthesis
MMWRIPATADVMIFPAQGEGFGLAAAEALMSGVPVVACWDGGGVLDVVPESGAGRLTLPSPDPMADTVLGLLGDPDRLALARLVGESWRARLAPDHVAELCEGGTARRSVRNRWLRTLQWAAGLILCSLAGRCCATGMTSRPSRSPGG